MSLEYCDLTDVGMRRANNQDSKEVLPPLDDQQYRTRGWVFVVADGMGAHAAGETASALATEQVPLTYEKLASRSPPWALRTSIEQANADINARGDTSPDLKGMGTTCTALVILPRGALVGHVGDSRAYRVHGARIEQLSRDHSLAWELEALQAAEGGHAGPAVPRNIITRSLGPHPHVDVDIEGPFSVAADDVFVVCSDGLSGQVADEEIGVVAANLPPRPAAETLVGLALVRGAPDNTTVIVARAGDREATRSSSADAPWLLTPPTDLDREPRDVPWLTLAGAAGCLFATLLCGPQVRTLAPPWVLLAVALAAGFVACLLRAILVLVAPRGGDERVLPVGARLGRGPYRSHDCKASAAIVDGITASVESAADGLPPEQRDRIRAQIDQCRQQVVAGHYPRALAAAAAAIAVYRESVETARTEAAARRPPG